MARGGHQTLVDYPGGDSRVITLYVAPTEGQIIAHGWQVTRVAAAGLESDLPVEYRISVARPASERSARR